MLSAFEAKKLYEAPPLTLEEIEERIKEAAKKQDFTCFDIWRVTPETKSLLADAGYTLNESSTSLIVNW